MPVHRDVVKDSLAIQMRPGDFAVHSHARTGRPRCMGVRQRQACRLEEQRVYRATV